MVRLTNGSRVLPGTEVTIAVERQDLSGESRRLYTLLRAALAETSGLPLAEPIEDPAIIARRIAAAKDISLQRYAGALPVSRYLTGYRVGRKTGF